MHIKLLVLSILSLPLAVHAQEPVVFPTSVKLVLGGDGVPGTVEPDPKLPPALRGQIVEQVSGWRFEPVDGQPLPSQSVTYAHLGICLAPTAHDPDSLDLVIDYRGLGPLAMAGSQQPPGYPVDAARAGYSAEMEVSYLVRPDGSAQLQDITYLEGGQSASRRRAFEPAIEAWVAKMRYLPEQLDGQPVSTAMRSPVSFWVGKHKPAAARARHEAGQADAAARTACAIAAGSAEADAVVIEPRLRRTPAGT